MKVKIKNDDKFILKLSHQEAKIIEQLLCFPELIPFTINDELFDKDEFKSNKDIERKVFKMFKKLVRKLRKVNVW